MGGDLRDRVERAAPVTVDARAACYITVVRRAAVSLTALVSLAAACRSGPSGDAPPTAPRRSCTLDVWYKPASTAAHVEVPGSWDNWARPARVLSADRADGWRVSSWDLAPGPYSYAIVDDGAWISDPNVATSAFHDGQEVAWVTIPNCEAPAIRIDNASGSADGHAWIEATFLATRAGDAIVPATLTATDLTGAPVALAPPVVDANTGKLALTVSGLPIGKNAVLVSAKDKRGLAAEVARATIWIEPKPFDLRDTAIYQVMIDRYRDANGNALAAPSLASDRAGGHLDGVRKAIESGEFAAMGINTLWLSPLYANPTGTFPGKDGHEYSSYHGYWPIASRALEPLIADERSVDALVAAAHTRGIRVVFDVVPHHVHEQHPYYVEHKADGWFDGSCVCGDPSCDWSTHILDCWFASYLPDLDWQTQDVADQTSSDVAWWLDRFDGDGVRIDAVPMMPRAATRRIASDIRRRFDHPGHRSYVLGENFVGPGGYDLLRYQLGPAGLDGEFDFPLLWALRGAMGDQTHTLADLEAAVGASQQAWAGSDAVMGNTIGNHDMSRFASVSAGDGDGDGWTPAPQSIDPNVYSRQQMALGMAFTLPGAPVVYYGDEVALAGHQDPDSRRVMPSDDALSDLQKQTRDFTRTLGKTRACSNALRRGTYRTLAVDAEHLVFARESDGDNAIVVLQRNVSAAFSTSLPGIASGSYVEVFSGRAASLTPELTILDARPFSLQLFLPAESACVHP